MKTLTLLIIPIALVLGACGSGDDAEPLFEAQDGDLVDVHYVLTIDDGTEIDSSRARGVPFSFTVGAGDVIVGFDDAVRGRSIGDVQTVTIEPANAYGEWDPTLVVEVPIAPSQGDVEIGESVLVDGFRSGVVVEVEGDIAKVDTNHELAGEALTFEIEILAITRG